MICIAGSQYSGSWLLVLFRFTYCLIIMPGDIATREYHSDPATTQRNSSRLVYVLIVFVVHFRVVIRSEPNLKGMM